MRANGTTEGIAPVVDETGAAAKTPPGTGRGPRLATGRGSWQGVLRSDQRSSW